MHMTHNFASPGRIVAKYGGNAADASADAALAAEVGRLRANGWTVVLVHGGGPEIDQALASAGIETPRVAGLRVTTAAAIGVVERVLCGSANKRLVRALQLAGVPCVGISGEDAGLLRAEPMVLDGASLGYVGAVAAVDAAILTVLTEAGFVPVVAPLAMGADGLPYNVNADTAAGAIAAAWHADAYVAMTNVDRIRRDAADPASAIDAFTLEDARAFADSPACSGGMRPKVLAAVEAVNGGVPRAFVCPSGNGAIEAALRGEATVITAVEMAS